MKKTILFTFLFSLACNFSQSQTMAAFADSIRKLYNIPELNYAVVSSDEIVDIQALGNRRINSNSTAALTDRFRIGSNTKTVTSYIAWLLVKGGKIKWDTKFFDLYPELKPQSNPAYYGLTLQDFITFRANTIKWTYTNDTPTKKEISGNEEQQRYKFITWVLQQEPVAAKQAITFSNPAYVAAGLMLEKATGKDYKTLVKELGKTLNIDFDFGQPNYTNKNQTWGHDENLHPEKPDKNLKLNWLLPAGNVNVSLPDYVKFIQLQLQGLLGKSKIFTAAEFDLMHYGLPQFAYGWNWYTDTTTHLRYSFHKGNPGTFLSQVYICKDIDKAFIFFANVQSADAEEGLAILFDALNKKYSR